MADVVAQEPLNQDCLEVRPVIPPEQVDKLSREILLLKKKLNAVILAHNYQVPEIQDVADYVGDSLGLSVQASKTKADVIVFCGVHFMAETAKILNPERLVILPDAQAGCSLEESCPPDKLKALQETNPNFYTISYINCSAAVKALSDIICTSGNAIKIVKAAPEDRDLLFVPDENLGEWVMEKTGRKMTLWKGSCYVHVEFGVDVILNIKQRYPDAPVVAHPECIKSVRDVSDEVCSTEKMIQFCKTHPAKRFIIVTESGIVHRLKKECPGKEFIRVYLKLPVGSCICNECKYMKMNTLEKLLACMENLYPRIELSKEIIEKAKIPIQRMLEVSAQ